MDKRAMYDLKDMLCKELDELAKKRDITPGSLEMIHKLTDTIKNIDKILMLEDDDDGYSERGRRRDSMGRYSRDSGGYSQGGDWEARGHFGGGHAYDEGGSSYANRGKHYVRGHYSRDGGYSRDDGKDHMLHELGEMMEGADPEQRRILERAMQEIRKA